MKSDERVKSGQRWKNKRTGQIVTIGVHRRSQWAINRADGKTIHHLLPQLIQRNYEVVR